MQDWVLARPSWVQAWEDQQTYLRIGQAQHRCQLLSIWLGHVLLNLKPLLQAFPLQVREDSPRPGALPLVGLWHGVLGEDRIGTCGQRGPEVSGPCLLQSQ